MRYIQTYLCVAMFTLLAVELTGCRASRQLESPGTGSGRVPVLKISQHIAAPSAEGSDTSAESQSEELVQDPAKESDQSEFDSTVPPISQSAWVKSLMGERKVADDETVTIDLTGTSVSDADLAELSDTPIVSQLNFTETRISDAGLGYLERHPDLKILRLDETTVTDAGIVEIVKCSRLEFLGLAKTGITDQGLKQLSQKTDLRFLLLDHTAVTDRGIAYLKTMQSLEGLSLLNTSVSAKAIEKLKFDLPACSIIYKEDPNKNSDPASAHFRQSVGPMTQWHDSPTKLVQTAPNWLPQTESISMQSVSRVEDEHAPLPIIRPRNSTRSSVIEAQPTTQPTRANQNGWLGAQQSGSAAQSVARVGYTTPRR